MKKNVFLYVLLVFLIVINSFFLFNYLGTPDIIENKKGTRSPRDFIVKELNFDDEQMQQFEIYNRKHHQELKHIGDDIKELKDALFNKISEDSLNEKVIDSIAALIGEKGKEKDLSAFYHFRSIQELCNGKQKEIFKRIINDALHRVGKERFAPPMRNGDGEHRPPPMH